jgi:glutathione S-transferase
VRLSVSNYYSKVKMVLLEKGVPFAEEYVKTGSKDEAVLSCSPLGKVPFIRTEQGTTVREPGHHRLDRSRASRRRR